MINQVYSHSNKFLNKFAVIVKERQDKIPTMNWLPYKARFIANSSSCTTTESSKLLAPCLTAVQSHVFRYYETVCERSRKIYFGLQKFWRGTKYTEV